jgi:two-component system response regulator MtrA
MRPVAVIVEDDPDILELLTDILAGEEFRVVAHARPDLDAIRRDAAHPALFLLDLMLPGMSGIDLARQLRDIYPGAPIVGLSASRLMLEVAARSGLFQELIAKPFNLCTLLDVVEQCVRLTLSTGPLAS